MKISQRLKLMMINQTNSLKIIDQKIKGRFLALLKLWLGSKITLLGWETITTNTIASPDKTALHISVAAIITLFGIKMVYSAINHLIYDEDRKLNKPQYNQIRLF